MASLPDLSPRPFSVADYHRMIDAGILAEDERVELLEGVIVLMSPQKDKHAHAIEELTFVLARQLPDQYRLRCQLPLTLDEGSEPEPDLAVVHARGPGRPAGSHPRSALLAIEIAGESLRKDRLTKSRIYARAAIPEYWIVNLEDRCLEVYRDPDPESGVYRSSLKVLPGDEARSSAVDGVHVTVSDLFL